MSEDQQSGGQLLPVNEFCRKYPHWPTPSSLRAIIWEASTNGFAEAFVRVGRRILVDEKIFWECARKGRIQPDDPNSDCLEESSDSQ